MTYCDLQVLNRASILLAAILLIVPAVICQMPSCGFGAIGRHPNIDENVLTGEFVHNTLSHQDIIFHATEEYLKTISFKTNPEMFDDLCLELNKTKLLKNSLFCNLQDRTNMNYTTRVQKLFVPFNRILYYLTRTESSKKSANTVESTSTEKINQIHSDIKDALQQILCSMYTYLASVDRNLDIESSNEIEKLLDTDKEQIFSRSLYVYLRETLQHLTNST